MKQEVEKLKGRYIKLATLGVIFMTAIILGAGGVLTYWAYQSKDVLKVNNEPFPVRKTGEVIVLNVDYCKNLKVKGDLRMSFLSATSESFLPIAKEDGPKGCRQVDFPILLPKDLPPDTYRVKFRVVYEINPIKKGVVSEFQSQEFSVQ